MVSKGAAPKSRAQLSHRYCRSMSRRRRIMAAAVVLALVVAAAAAYFVYRAGRAPDPVSLITERPTVPGPEWRPIRGIATTDSRLCPQGSSAKAAWSISEDAFGQPAAFETVCVYRREPSAWSVYKWQ
jgi:hypothetical protein